MSDNNQREMEFVRGWKESSKRVGDHPFRMVHGWTGEGDYTDADWGEEPKQN